MTSALLSQDQLSALQRRHAEPQRHYHTWSHIEALLGWFDELKDRLFHHDAVELAILYHDAIYDPKAGDNEAASAGLLRGHLGHLIDADTIEKSARMILATAGHTLPAGMEETLASDCAFFLDMDLSILGAEKEAFDAFDQAIRKEYAHVPEADYRAGRARILRDFLDRDRLYFTDHFHARLDRPARNNLKRAIKSLEH